MSLFIGQRVKHKSLYNGKEIFVIAGLKLDEVLLEGDFSGSHGINQESWMPKKGLIYENRWGAWIDPEEPSLGRNAGPRDM
jgi:hypothetical protein